jgi:hypothetical protein
VSAQKQFDLRKTVESSHVLPKVGARNDLQIDAKLAGTAVFPQAKPGSKRISVNLLDGKAQVWQTLAHAVETSTGFRVADFSRWLIRIELRKPSRESNDI